MSEIVKPYLLFHPKFIRKLGKKRSEYGVWDTRQIRKTFEKKWWKSDCFAIDAELRKFELLDVKSKGPAWIIDNFFQPSDKVFLSIEYVFNSEAEQLTFDQARKIFVDTVCENKWWGASAETEAQFRARNARYTNWSDLIEPISLKGKLA